MENGSIYTDMANAKLLDKSLVIQNRSIYSVVESSLLIDKSSDMENESKVKMMKSAPPLLKSDLSLSIRTGPESIFQ